MIGHRIHRTNCVLAPVLFLKWHFLPELFTWELHMLFLLKEKPGIPLCPSLRKSIGKAYTRSRSSSLIEGLGGASHGSILFCVSGFSVVSPHHVSRVHHALACDSQQGFWRTAGTGSTCCLDARSTAQA